jgi:hypothetical protein
VGGALQVALVDAGRAAWTLAGYLVAFCLVSAGVFIKRDLSA